MTAFRSTSLFASIASAAPCRPESLFVRFCSKNVPKFTDGPIDPEINFHSNLSHRWWDMKTISPLHYLNEVRVPFIREGIHQSMPQNAANPGLKTELEGVNILDVGCGGGILSEALARLKANVVGLDPSPDLIRIARQHAECDPHLESYLKYESESVHNFSQKNRYKFDAVVVSEVIEHVANKDKLVYDCLECLKPGGSIFFTAPNKTLIARLLIITMAERLGVIPMGTHDYAKFITAEDLSKLLKEYGCSIKRVEGIYFNLITKKFSFSAFKHLMYAIHAQKTAGNGGVDDYFKKLLRSKAAKARRKEKQNRRSASGEKFRRHFPSHTTATSRRLLQQYKEVT